MIEQGKYALIHGLGSWQTMPDGTELAVIANANHSATMQTIQKNPGIRSSGRTPMLVYSDVESMQFYNKQYGVDEGDALLRLVAASLEALEYLIRVQYETHGLRGPRN